jgi:hypothetical protein
MKSIVFFCVGKRDIVENKNRNWIIFKNEAEIKNIDLNDYSFPIVDKFLKKIRENNIKIEKIFIFATRQQPLHEKDTIFNASVIKKLLCNKYNFGERKITIQEFNEDPSDYDKAYKFFSNFFNNFKEKGRFVINISSGTPAMTFSLVFNSLIHSNKKDVEIFYVSENDSVKKLILRNFIYQELAKETFKTLKEKKLFAIAADFGKKYLDLPLTEIKFLIAEDEFLKFNFKRAKKLFIEVKNKSTNTEMRNEAENKLKLIEELESNDCEKKILTKLKILLDYLLIKKESFEYTEFIASLFRFYEQSLIIGIKLAFDFDVDNNYNINKETFREKAKSIMERYKNESEELMKKYKDKHKKELDVEQPTTDTFIFFINLYLNLKNKDKNITEIVGIVDKIGKIIDKYKLRELRNNSILAHGFKGIGKKDIKNTGDVLNKFKDFISKIESYYSSKK